MTDIQSIVVLTGAGISAESGVPTFRGSDGLWEGHRVEDVATPDAYARDPDLVLDFYDQRRANLDRVTPNEAHEALGRLDAEWPGELLIVTQNVDDLHERGGATRLLHMHGELKKGWCLALEPMVNVGGDAVYTMPDKWTVATLDGSFSAHFEHTIAITNNGPKILSVGTHG